ncbi:MAG: hypothetical protein M0P74_00985 [Syntrophales bacterium]|nr:hypothetical protein [Syntrophales bacterium]
MTIFRNNTITNDPCDLCGARCDPMGLDYGIGLSLVCDSCAAKYRPDLVAIREAALSYAEAEKANETF